MNIECTKFPSSYTVCPSQNQVPLVAAQKHVLNIEIVLIQIRILFAFLRYRRALYIYVFRFFVSCNFKVIKEKRNAQGKINHVGEWEKVTEEINF